MQKIIIIIMLFLSCQLHAANVDQWVEIGSAKYEVKKQDQEICPYIVKFFLPFGANSIPDTKEGLYPMRFELTWAEDYPIEKVRDLFLFQLESHFDDPEGFILYNNFIQIFMKKLKPAKKGDVWLFENYPDEGTRVFVGEKKIHHLIGVEFNRAMYNSWLNVNLKLTSQLLSKLENKK